MTPEPPALDRTFATAFGISLACHAVFLGYQFVELGRHPAQPARVLDVVYEQAAEQKLRRLQTQLADMKERAAGLPDIKAPESRIRIPDRSVGMGSSSMMSGASGTGQGITARAMGELSGDLSDAGTSRAPVVDLTNLVDAAQGNPVLLSYFGAIREQIQRTANRNAWLSGEAKGGLVYVSFVLSANGQVQSASVVSNRSAQAPQLQEVALRIIKASSPFPPFPPSIGEPAKTIVVPLEFLLGS